MDGTSVTGGMVPGCYDPRPVELEPGPAHSNCMNAAAMSLELHGCGSHAVGVLPTGPLGPGRAAAGHGPVRQGPPALARAEKRDQAGHSDD
jgi:hypothetical protein